MLGGRLAEQRGTVGYAWVMLALTFGVHLVDAMLRQGFSALAPFYQQDLGLSRAQVGLISSAMSLGGVALLLPAGALSDRVSLRRLLPVGLALTALTLVAIAVADTFPVLLALFFATGLWHAAVSPGTSKAVAHWFAARQRGTAMSIKQTGIPLGGILAATALPPVALVAGWRGALWVTAAATGLAAVVVLVFWREHVLGRKAGPAQADGELRQCLREPALWVASIVAAAFGAAQLVSTTYLTLYVKEVHGRDAVAAAAFLAWAFVGGAVGRIFWGLVSDRLCGGARGPVLAAIGGLAAACAVALGTARGPWPTPLLILVAVGLGVSAIGWNGVYLAVLAELAGPRTVGIVTAVGLFVANIGLVSGPPLFGWLVDLTGSYQPAWLALAGLCAAAGWASLVWLRGSTQRW